MLLDDPVSALDAKVGKAVFKEVIRGICKEKTTIMATHAVDFFELADKIILMENGEVEAFGHLNDIKTNKVMQAILKEHEEQRERTLAAAKKNENKEAPPKIEELKKKMTKIMAKRVTMHKQRTAAVGAAGQKLDLTKKEDSKDDSILVK